MGPEDSDQSTGYQQKAWYYPTFSGGAQTAKPRVCLLPPGTFMDLTRSSDDEDNDDEDDMYYGDNDEDDYGDGVCLVPCKAKTNTKKRYLFKNTKKLRFFCWHPPASLFRNPGPRQFLSLSQFLLLNQTERSLSGNFIDRKDKQQGVLPLWVPMSDARFAASKIKTHQ